MSLTVIFILLFGCPATKSGEIVVVPSGILVYVPALVWGRCHDRWPPCTWYLTVVYLCVYLPWSGGGVMTDDHHVRDISQWYTCVYLPWSGGGVMTDDHHVRDISQWYTCVYLPWSGGGDHDRWPPCAWYLTVVYWCVYLPWSGGGDHDRWPPCAWYLTVVYLCVPALALERCHDKWPPCTCDISQWYTGVCTCPGLGEVSWQMTTMCVISHSGILVCVPALVWGRWSWQMTTMCAISHSGILVCVPALVWGRWYDRWPPCTCDISQWYTGVCTCPGLGEVSWQMTTMHVISHSGILVYVPALVWGRCHDRWPPCVWYLTVVYWCVYLPWSGGGVMTDDHHACDISQWYTGVCTCPGLGEVSWQMSTMCVISHSGILVCVPALVWGRCHDRWPPCAWYLTVVYSCVYLPWPGKSVVTDGHHACEISQFQSC